MSQTFLEDIPEFLEIQRSSFLRILDNGLIQALEKINPISPTSQCEYGLLFYPKDYVLVLPETTVTEAFLQGKTYGCKIYVPAIVYETQKQITSNLKKKSGLPLALPQRSVAQRVKASLQGTKRGTKLAKKKIFGSDTPQALSQSDTALWTKGNKESQYFLSQKPSSFFGKKSQEKKMPQGFILPKYPLFSSTEGQGLLKGLKTKNHQILKEGMSLKSQGKISKIGSVGRTPKGQDKDTFVELLPLLPKHDRAQKNNIGWNKYETILNFKTINKKNLIKKFNKLAWFNPVGTEHKNDNPIMPKALNTESHRPSSVNVSADQKFFFLWAKSKNHKAKGLPKGMPQSQDEYLPLESRNVKVDNSKKVLDQNLYGALSLSPVVSTLGQKAPPVIGSRLHSVLRYTKELANLKTKGDKKSPREGDLWPKSRAANQSQDHKTSLSKNSLIYNGNVIFKKDYLQYSKSILKNMCNLNFNLHFLLRKTYKNPKLTDKKQPSKTLWTKSFRRRAIGWKESLPFSSLVTKNFQFVEDTKTLMSMSWPFFCQTTWTRTTKNSFGRPLKTFEKEFIGAKYERLRPSSSAQKLVERDKVKATKSKKVSLLGRRYNHLGFANTSIGSCKSPSSQFWSKILFFLDGLPQKGSATGQLSLSKKGGNNSQKLNLGMVSETKEKNSQKKRKKETLTVMPQRGNPWTKQLTLAPWPNALGLSRVKGKTEQDVPPPCLVPGGQGTRGKALAQAVPNPEGTAKGRGKGFAFGPAWAKGKEEPCLSLASSTRAPQSPFGSKSSLIEAKEPNNTQNKNKILDLEINLKLWPTSSVSPTNVDFFREKLKSVRSTSILASIQTPFEDALSKNEVLTPNRNTERLQVKAQVPKTQKVHFRSHSWSTVNNDVLENKELKKNVAHASVITLRSVPLGLTDKSYGKGFAKRDLPMTQRGFVFGLPRKAVGGKTLQGLAIKEPQTQSPKDTPVPLWLPKEVRRGSKSEPFGSKPQDFSSGQSLKVDSKGTSTTEGGLYSKENFIRLALTFGTVSPLNKKKEVLIKTLCRRNGSEALGRPTKSKLTMFHNLISKGFDIKLLKSKIFVLSLGLSKGKFFDLRLKGFNKKLKPFGLVLRANFFSSRFDNFEILDGWSGFATSENVIFQKKENSIKTGKKKGQLNTFKLTKKEKNVQKLIKLRLWWSEVFEQSSLVHLFPKKKKQLIDKNSSFNFNFSNKAFGSGSKVREIVSSSNQKLTKLKEKPLSKKEWVCIGLLPLMTPRGHFIINGSHRIVVSQMSRAPGLYYQTGEKLQATLVPSKGAWLRMSVKVNDNGEIKIWVRITPQRKMPYKIFLETYKYLENYKEQQKEHAPKSKFLNLTYKNINSKIKHFDKHYAIGVISGQINRTLLNMSSYTLGRLGRQRLNERLGICEKKGYITSKDISLIKNNLLKFLDHNNSTNFDDDIDHLENRRVRTCGELLQTEIEVGMTRLKKAIVKQLDDYLNKNSSTFLVKEKQTTENLINDKNRVEGAKKASKEKEPQRISPKRLEDLKMSRSKALADLPRYNTFWVKPLAKQRAFSLEARLLGEEISKRNNKQKNWPHKVGIYFTFIYSKKPIIQTQNYFYVKKLKSRLQDFTYAPSDEEKVKPFRKPEYSPNKLLDQSQESLKKKNQTLLKVGGRTVQWSPSKIVGTKAFAGALREFFGSNPLSQYMDQTNPLAEITHKRRLSSLGPGGVDRASAGIAIRGIHPSHYGRICPIETPEGKNAGLVNSMTMWARINKDGFLETPYIKVQSGSIMSQKANLSPEWFFIPTKKESRGLQTNSQTDYSVLSNTYFTKEDYKLGILETKIENNYAQKTKGLKIVALDLKISESSFLPNILLPTRDESERSFGRHKRNVIDFCGVSPTQNISVATSLIPFLEHDDATRALMGSNMQRQAVPLLKAQGPLVRTGLEGKVVGESGHALQATSSGLISKVTRGSISIDTFISDQKSSVPFIHTIINKQKNSSLGWQKSYSYSSWRNPLYKDKVYKDFGIFCPSRQKFVKGDSVPLLALERHLGYGLGTKLPHGNGLGQALGKAHNAKKKIVGGQFLDKCLFALRQPCPKGLRSDTSESKSQKLPLLPKNFWRKSLKISRERKTQILQDYTRSNQATLCVQRPAVKEGRWIQKGDLIGDCSASLNGVLALGQNIVVAYLPMEGFNFEDAIVVSDRLVREELYTSIHIQRVEFDMDALVKKHIPPKIKVKKQKSAYKTIQQDWITWHNPHLLKSEKDNLSSLGIIKVGSWVGPGDVLVSKVFPVERKIAPSRHLLSAVFQEKKKKTIDTDDTSLRVPKGIHGRVINVKIVGNGTIIPPNSPFSSKLTEVMVLPKQTTSEKPSTFYVPKTKDVPSVKPCFASGGTACSGTAKGQAFDKIRENLNGHGGNSPYDPQATDSSPSNSIGDKLVPRSYASLAQQSNLKLKRNNTEQLLPLTPTQGFRRFARLASARPKILFSRFSFYGTKKPWREFNGKIKDRHSLGTPFSVYIQSAFPRLNLADFSTFDSQRSRAKAFWTSSTNETSSNYFGSKKDLLQDVPQKVFGFSKEKLWLPQQNLIFSNNTYEKPKSQVSKVELTTASGLLKARLYDSKVPVSSTSRVSKYLEVKNFGTTNLNFFSVKDSQKQEEIEKFQKNWAKLWLKIQTYPKTFGSFQNVGVLPTLHALSLPYIQNIKSFKVTEPVKQKTQIDKIISRFFSHKESIGRLYGIGLLSSESTRSPWTKNQNISSLTSPANFKMLANSDKKAFKFRSSIPLTQAEIQTSNFGFQDNKSYSWSESYAQKENSLLLKSLCKGQKTLNQKITFAGKKDVWIRDSIGSSDVMLSTNGRGRNKFKIVPSFQIAKKLYSLGLLQGTQFLPQRGFAFGTAQKAKEQTENQKTNFLNSSTLLENQISSKFKELELEKIKIEGEYKIVQIRVYIAERKKLQVGDKMSGRHGNKGIVSTILPREDMPYLPDGTPVDMVLNPLGIPSRMNVGQVFECLLGLAASVCGEIIGHTPFDEMYGPEASRSLVYLFLYVARLRARTDWLFQPNFPGKTIVFDGRTGTPFEQWVTVGRAYMLKLIHMVDEKIHARSIGPRSLVTQQPVKGRARGGGQRLGEMELWAFEGFGAAYTLQEILTLKSDDIKGRENVENSIIFATTARAHIPETFRMMLFELRCLCLNVELNQNS